VVFRRRKKRHASIEQVAGERVAEIVVGDLADEPRAAAEARQPVAGVGHRTAARHDAVAHLCTQKPRALVADEHHRRFRQVVGGKKRLVDAGDDVDHRVADGHGMQDCWAHDLTNLGSFAVTCRTLVPACQ